jgi:ABC-type multidrug transport system ATPase subunit/prenyltransferase beta subunit
MFNISRRNKKRLKRFILFLILIGTTLITLVIVNVRFISYIDESVVQNVKYHNFVFTKTHQNEFGLFVEPNIDANFRAVDSINFSTMGSNLINPNAIPNSYLSTFFKNYLIEKQNLDGSYSDLGGLGSMTSTYQVISTLDILNPEFVDSYQNYQRIIQIENYLNSSFNIGGWGFVANEYLNDSDISTTFSAIWLANRLSMNFFLNNQNLKNYVNSTLLPAGSGLGYSLTNNTLQINAETTFYGISAFKLLNMNYTWFENSTIYAFISSLYNSIDGGYRNPLSAFSDVQSTFYALSCLNLLGYSYHNASTSLDFILSCRNTDGGFAMALDGNMISEFKSGWAAIKSIELLEQVLPLSLTQKNLINTIKIDYYNWLHYYQAQNGLFGQITIESNYFGVLTFKNYAPNSFITLLEQINISTINNILIFTRLCYNVYEGGFGSQPNQNATLFATYCALNIAEIFYEYRFTEIKNFLTDYGNDTALYIIYMQNPDGGFKAGNDVYYIASLFGPYFRLFLGLIDFNSSTVESTYWALDSLEVIGAETRDAIDHNNLTHWIRASQNADGGFAIYIGFHSDVVSTYYGLEIFNIFYESDPMSKMAAIEFLKNAQISDGSFSLLPMLGDFLSFPSNFLMTYLASKALYDYSFQPENIKMTLKWYAECLSMRTGGTGDNPGFGGDLRNSPYSILIIDELKVDQSFDSKPWNRLLIYVLLIEAGFVTLYIIIKLYNRLSIPQKLKLRLGIGAKLTSSYLQQFPAITCENLSIFAGRKLIVDSVSLKLDHGKILGILGESGAGKSTFVKGLLGMRKITGICQIYGLDMNKRNSRRIRPIYGYVPQDLSKLYQDFTVIENLLYFGIQYGLTEKEVSSRAKRILRSLEIESKKDELVKNLSGGQKRRVSIAVGLIHSPIFLILDEPTSGLDPIIRENLWLTLTSINENYGTTLIVITHYPEESRFCNYVAIFGRNRGMIDYGKPKELLSQLPGKGRTIEVSFQLLQTNVIEKLEKVSRIEKVLENKVGFDYSIFSDLNLKDLEENIESIFGSGSIAELKQKEAQMEQFFRYKAMEVPKVEEL